MTSIVAISDLQVPYHNPRAVENICTFMDEYDFDQLVNVGDDTDSPEPSRWNKGMAGEYAPTLQAGLRQTEKVHAQFRDALGDRSKPYHVMRSNHGDRVQTYVRKYAPALESLDCLRLPELLGYDRLDITYHEQPYEFAPGWLLLHGDEGGTSTFPGGTALGLARATGMSVLCGHTHKLGAAHLTTGYSGKQKVRWGIEAGHLMDVKKASYLKTGSANWHAGFVVFHVDGRNVSHNLVQVNSHGGFVFDGVRYGKL